MEENFPNLTDGEVVTAVLAGQNDQFDLLVTRYRPALLRMAKSRMGRLDWAEDVVQETFLNAFKWLRSYDSRYSFRTWLWTILLNQCRRQLKKRSRALLVRSWTDHRHHGSAPEQLSEQLGSTEKPSDHLDAVERSELLDALLCRLPDAQADALRLRFFGGLKFVEIANAMNCSLSTAKNRVRGGLERMAAFMESESSDSRGADGRSGEEILR